MGGLPKYGAEPLLIRGSTNIERGMGGMLGILLVHTTIVLK